MSTTKIALSPEEVDILIESLRSWGACEAVPGSRFLTAALCDRLVTVRRARHAHGEAHAEALADSDCPDEITLCPVCGYDIDGDDLAFACNCPNDIDLGVGSEHPER